MIKKYKEFKSSKFKWFEEVPVNWLEGKISYYFGIGRGRVISELELNPDAFYPVYSSQTKNDGCLGFIDTYDFDDNILTWTTDGANAGTVFIRSGKFNCTNVCGTLKPKVDVDLKYYLYYLQTMTPFYKRPDTNGAKIMNNEMASIYCLIPPIQEQIKIAQYLDHQTAIIDQLIQQKEKLIELLKEKRQAVINEAVTKGLNANAKMKDSGIEWLGELPEEWEIMPLKHLASLKGRLGWKGLKADEYIDNGFGFLSTPDIKNEFIDFKSINFITEERYLESPEIMLKNGDVLLVKDGSTLGIVNYIRELPFPTTVNSSIGIIRVLDRNILNPEYLFWQLKSDYMQTVISRLKSGQGVPHLFQKYIKKFEVLVPAIKSQFLIVEFIKTKSRDINKIINQESVQIEKIKEYRQSIISEAVTGKIDVRDWVHNKQQVS
jgi:type I restriction enzyme S subunit